MNQQQLETRSKVPAIAAAKARSATRIGRILVRREYQQTSVIGSSHMPNGVRQRTQRAYKAGRRSRTIINHPKCGRIRLDNKCRIRNTGACGSHDRRDSDFWHLERQPQRREPQNSMRPIFDFQSLGELSATNTDHCTKPHFSSHAGQSLSIPSPKQSPFVISAPLPVHPQCRQDNGALGKLAVKIYQWHSSPHKCKNPAVWRGFSGSCITKMWGRVRRISTRLQLCHRATY